MAPLTLGLRLPVEVVEQLGVAGEHAAAGGAGHHLLLGVAPQMFPQAVPDLKEGVATCNPEGSRYWTVGTQPTSVKPP